MRLAELGPTNSWVSANAATRHAPHAYASLAPHAPSAPQGTGARHGTTGPHAPAAKQGTPHAQPAPTHAHPLESRAHGVHGAKGAARSGAAVRGATINLRA